LLLFNTRRFKQKKGNIMQNENCDMTDSLSGIERPASPRHLSPDTCHVFQRLPGETPRAFGAFMTWFQLGHARSHQAVADKLAEGLPTVKNWASKYDWSERLIAFNAGLFHQQAADLAEQHRKQAADWAARLSRFREQEWDAAQKLLSAAQCFLETFGDDALQKMTLSQVSRALRISSDIGRLALAGAELPQSSDPVMSPIQQQMLDALRRLSTGHQSSSSSPDPRQSSNPPIHQSTTGPASPGFLPSPPSAERDKGEVAVL
jgi:hypothetical protein